MNLNSTICIITTVHSGLDARIYLRQAKSLASAGYKVHIIAPRGFDNSNPNITFQNFKPVRIKWFRLFTNFRYMTAGIRSGADVYHFHDPDFILFALVIKIVTRKIVLFDVHEDFSKVLMEADWLPSGVKNLFSRIYTFIEYRSSKVFDGIITATEHIASKFDAEKAVVIHNYPRKHVVKSREKIKNSIVFIGGLTKIRGIKEMLKAVMILNKKLQVEIHIFGEFTDKTFEREILRDYSQDYIHFHGFVKNEEVYSKMAAYEIGIVPYLPLPNHIEAMPTKIFEYMMVGNPIAGSNFELWKQIIEHQCAGATFNPEDAEDIAEVLHQMLKDEDRLKDMASKARMLFNDKYSWDAEEKRFLDHYKALGDNLT